MSPETKRVVLGHLGGRRSDAYKELVRVRRDRLARGLSPSEGAAVEALLDEMEAIDAAVAELESEAAPGAIVTSKTQTREDGSERTVHYLCGDQRGTREEALRDLCSWLALPGLEAFAKTVNERLNAVGFQPGRAGLVALIAERRELWESLAALLVYLTDQGLLRASHPNNPVITIAGRAIAAVESSWLADPANREGGAE